jgi:hypothetical protein
MSRLTVGGVAVCMLLAGCAPAAYNKAQVEPDRFACDFEMMQRVEQAAMKRPLQIIWVNCPQRTLRT